VFRSSEPRSGDPVDVSIERLSGRVHVLAERVDTLAQTVATTAAAIAKKDGELAVLRRELDGSQARVHAALAEARPAHDGELDELRKRVAALAAERERSSDESRVGRLETKVAQLGERVDTLATTVATTAAGLAGREGDVVALRRRVEQLAGGPAAGPALDDVLRERIDNLGTATASFSMRIEGQTEQISSLRETVASVAEATAARWRELEHLLAEVAARLDAVELQREQRDAALARATSLWPAALRSLEARVEQLRLGTDPSPTAPGAADLSVADVGRFLGEIRALERRLDETETHARQEQEELGARVRRLESDRVEGSARPTPLGADVLPFRGQET